MPATVADSIETDALVIGAGIAGSIAALAAADAGAEVLVIQLEADPAESNTYWAQGGIIHRGVEDSPELLAGDIEAAGAGLCFGPAVERLSADGPGLVERILIDRLGVEFDRKPDGSLDLTGEAAHSRRRIIHARDRTGKAIAERLTASLAGHPRIRQLKSVTAIDLLTLSHHSKHPLDIYEPPTCAGVYAFFREEGTVRALLARQTALATGGLGQLFLHTTNPRLARGDGVAMAYRAGARLLNLEYVQFHPTALYEEKPRRFLISEAVRGEGGRLTRRDGTAFVEKYDPRGSLAPRDIVARAIHEELLTHDEPFVYLDISHKPADWIRERFPQIHAVCLEAGIDITREPMPVVPAAHYSCGGVAVDLEGRTSIRGLSAVGEVACNGLHGANRLASTSLLEAVVFGHLTGKAMAEALGETRGGWPPPIQPWKEEAEPVDPALILQDWLTIKYTMWNYVGLVRTAKRLQRALRTLRDLQTEIESFYDHGKLGDGLIGLRHGVQAALAVTFAALENRVSRGCHYRLD